MTDRHPLCATSMHATTVTRPRRQPHPSWAALSHPPLARRPHHAHRAFMVGPIRGVRARSCPTPARTPPPRQPPRCRSHLPQPPPSLHPCRSVSVARCAPAPHNPAPTLVTTPPMVGPRRPHTQPPSLHASRHCVSPRCQTRSPRPPPPHRPRLPRAPRPLAPAPTTGPALMGRVVPRRPCHCSPGSLYECID